MAAVVAELTKPSDPRSPRGFLSRSRRFVVRVTARMPRKWRWNRKNKVEIGQNMRDIEQAPKIFRERLLALKEAGVLDDPAFKQAVLDAVEEVLAEPKVQGPEEPCSESSPESGSENW